MATQSQQAADPGYLGIMAIMGRNGSDPSFVIPDRQCLDAVNINWYRSSLGRKRNGAANVALTGGTAFANGLVSGTRFVPGFDQTAAEMWAIDGSRNFHRMAGGAAFVDPTVIDACSATPQEVNWQPFNGKLYAAYKNAHNRLHTYDPVTGNLRRVGIDLPVAPTLGAVTGGAVTATRKYRVSWAVQASGVTILRSNLSSPSGSQALVAQQVVVNQPAVPANEHITHWEVWEAQDASFADYRLLSTVAVATTTYADNTATQPSTVAPADGAHTPPPSARYMAADDARLILGGCYEVAANTENAMAPSDHRVFWTSILNASNVGDDERISNTGTINGYADLEEAITGISQPMQLVSAQASSLERGSFYVFSFGSQWKFVSTGDATTPYLRFRVTGGQGCIHHKSIVTALDTNGNPAIYWAAAPGIFRISANGQEFCSEDNSDIWARINLDATIPCHAIYHADIHQIWFYIAVDGASYPNLILVFDTRLGRVVDITGVRFGWSQYQGEMAKAYCSFMFSASIGASMGRKLKPYIGYTGSTALWRCDDDSSTDDGGNLFQAYLDSKSYAPWGLGRKGGTMGEAKLVAASQSGVTVHLTMYRNEGAESVISAADLTPVSDSKAETKVFPKFENTVLADSFSLRVRIGDLLAVSNGWNLEGLVVPLTAEGES